MDLSGIRRGRFGTWQSVCGECGSSEGDASVDEEGAEPRGSAPFDASVRTAGSLVAAEVGHALVQARAADAHERQADDLMVNPAHGGALRC